MRKRAVIFADSPEQARPPRILEPLQHVFDPIMSATGLYRQATQWSISSVANSRFSDSPKIVFDRLPALPAEVWEMMLYDLRCRLAEPSLHIRRNLPGLTFCPHARCDAIDAPVTILPA